MAPTVLASKGPFERDARGVSQSDVSKPCVTITVIHSQRATATRVADVTAPPFEADRTGKADASDAIQRAINASHVHLPPYDENEGGWLDHLTELIRKAKLAPYRTELLALLTSWQAGEVRISEPLNRIEELIDQEVLDPDVLILHGDYEHYRYD